MAFATRYTKTLERASKRALKASKLETMHDKFPPVFHAYAIDEELLYRPLIGWRKELDSHPHSPSDFTRTSVEFKYDLFTAESDPSGRGRDQNVLAKQAIERLKDTSTAFIAAHTGYGKCLGKGTHVMRFNGDVDYVENIRKGDLLMGEGGKMRTVLGTCKGEAPLYKMCLSTGESFVTNGDHILVVEFLAQGRVYYHNTSYYVSWFNGKRMDRASYESLDTARKAAVAVIETYGMCFEISVNNFIRLPCDVVGFFSMYWSPVSYDYAYSTQGMYSCLADTPAAISLFCADGDLDFIPKKYAMGSVDVRRRVLSMFPRDSFINGISVIHTRTNKMAQSVLSVLRSLGHYCTLQSLTDVIFSTASYDRCYIQFYIEEMKYGEYYGFELDGDGRFLLSNFVVTHNTSMGAYLLSKFRYKTAILCPLEGLKKQWKEEIEKFTESTAKVQIVRGKTKLRDDADVYIFGSTKAATMSRDDLLDIGMVIVDEAHMNTACVFTKSLLNFQPRYVIGLSATPDRADGLTSLMEHHFGPSTEFLYRREVKEFTVIKYTTSYVMEDEYIERGGDVCLDWTTMISTLSTNVKRIKEIAHIAINSPEHKIMILCGRKHTAIELQKYLEKKGESVALFIGSAKTWDRSKRILVAGVKKGGVGLNDPDLTMLILEADMKDVRQCEGRIRTTRNVVYDIVDINRLLESHWCKRRAWFRKRGAIIVDKDGKVLNNVKTEKERKRFLKPNL